MNSVKLPMELGALTDVPIYEDNRSWAASIEADPKSPGALRRSFWERGKGAYYYIIPTDIKVGTAVEFGADIHGKRKKEYVRWYGVITSVSDKYIELEEWPTGALACAESRRLLCRSIY